MKLNGIDLRVLPGAVMVYCLTPLRHVPSPSLNDAEQQTLIQLSDRVTDARESAYKLTKADEQRHRGDVISARLSVSLDLTFSEAERELLGRALEACAIEMEHGGDVNIHFNGDEYGVNPAAFRDLAARLQAEV